MLRGLYIGTSLQKRRGESGRHCRERLLFQQTPSLYWTGISAHQHTDLIFCLLYLALRVGYGLGGSVNELLSLPHVQDRGCAVRLPALDQTHGFLASGQCLSRNVEFPVLL